LASGSHHTNRMAPPSITSGSHFMNRTGRCPVLKYQKN